MNLRDESSGEQVPRDVCVIVVGAGKGERFGGNDNKIFAKIDEQPLFLKALQLFCNREDVCQTILVVSPEDMGQVKEKFGPNLGFMGIQLVEGGAQRHDSVRNGLAAVNDDAKFVAVHDAVRICLAEAWIDEIFQTARSVDGLLPVTPVTSTLKRIGKDGAIEETVSRAGLFLAQTPQVFKREVLTDAYAKLSDDDAASITDDAQVAALAGYKIGTIDGDARNLKITTKDDLALVKSILKSLPQKQITSRGVFDEAQW